MDDVAAEAWLDCDNDGEREGEPEGDVGPDTGSGSLGMIAMLHQR